MSQISQEAVAGLLVALLIGLLQLIFTILSWWEVRRNARDNGKFSTILSIYIPILMSVE